MHWSILCAGPEIPVGLAQRDTGKHRAVTATRNSLQFGNRIAATSLPPKLPDRHGQD
jgi:hypothetical protein